MSESGEIVDALTVKRNACAETKEALRLKKRLEKCSKRVEKAPGSESCFEEILDYVNSVDHCAMQGLFSKLK